MKNISIKQILVLVSCLLPSLVLADIAVIVNKDNAVSLTDKQIRNIFLAKTNAFPGGDKALPLDISDNESIKKVFDKKVLRKTQSSLNSYWSRMIFSAKGAPPQIMSMLEVKARVAKEKSAIGYVDAALVDDSVKVIHTIEL